VSVDVRGAILCIHQENAMSKDDVPITDPKEYDRSTGQRVEKKPEKPESPQQEHENEDQG